tara:strand:- start:169 stop:1419 length:1251 start_codon:yes stop_codon:yes gene_type:complete
MNLENIYHSNKDSIIGFNHANFNNHRKKLIDNFNLDNKILKNNDSTKFFDNKILKNLKYSFNNSKESFEFISSKNKDNKKSIIINNGNQYKLSNFNSENIEIYPFQHKQDEIMKKILDNKDKFDNDYIVNLNSILLNSSLNFILNKDSNEEINIDHNVSENGSTIFSKNFFSIKENSKLVIIENFNNSSESNLNVMNFINVGKNSEVIHLVLQSNSIKSNLQFTTYIENEENSKFRQFIFNVSDGFVRNHHYADLKKNNSEAALNGVFMASSNQIVDNKTSIRHLEENCKSNQTYKAILTDKAKASYLSNTFVDQKAQKTSGYQLSKGILLSDGSFFHSKPELKIYADDVKCSHGSTIGTFDKDVLFYLRTRGLNETDSKRLLIKSYYLDLIEDINNEHFINELEKLSNKWINEKI